MSKQYKLRNDGGIGVIDVGNNLVLSPDPSGYHWRKYMEWVMEGNDPDPPDPEPPIQIMISKMAIINRLTVAEAEAIDAARPLQPAKDRLMWEAATQIDPSHSTIVAFLDAVIGEARRMEVLAPE